MRSTHRRATIVTAALALGAAAVVAGIPAGASGGTADLEICKVGASTAVSGTFHFSVAGQSVAVPVGSCSPTITVPAGTNTITEQKTSGYRLKSVSADPSDRLTSTNLSAQTATVNLPAGGTGSETIVTFTNKVAPTGYIEICKDKPSGDPLTGSFTFTIDGGHSTSVAVGSCSSAIEVPTGNHTVAETAKSGSDLVSITGNPSGSVSNVNLTSRSATVAVTSGAISAVTFTNETTPQNGTLKVCKVAGSGVTDGQLFTFTVDGGSPFQVAAGSCSSQMQVTAGNHTVREAAASGYSVSAISTTPAGALVSSSLSNRTATVDVPAGSVVDVSFTNQKSTGTLKVCKVAGTGVTAGQPFPFSVDNGSPFSVPAGSCSLPMTLPSGHHTVVEGATNGYHATDMAVPSDSAGSLVSSDLSTQTAVVDVEPGVTVLNVTNATTPPQPPQTSGCTRTKGYYKTHASVTNSLVGSGLMVGGTNLSGSQVLDILNRTETGGNVVLQLEQQLIAALLNQRAGASSTSDVDTAIAAAQKLISENGGALNPSGKGSTTVVYNGTTYTAAQLESILDDYNNGAAPGGPSHC
jgi:hypothetical protein